MDVDASTELLRVVSDRDGFVVLLSDFGVDNVVVYVTGDQWCRGRLQSWNSKRWSPELDGAAACVGHHAFPRIHQAKSFVGCTCRFVEIRRVWWRSRWRRRFSGSLCTARRSYAYGLRDPVEVVPDDLRHKKI